MFVFSSLPSATKLRQGNVLHLSVILFTGECLATSSLGTHTPGHTPRAHIPLPGHTQFTEACVVHFETFALLKMIYFVTGVLIYQFGTVLFGKKSRTHELET